MKTPGRHSGRVLAFDPVDLEHCRPAARSPDAGGSLGFMEESLVRVKISLAVMFVIALAGLIAVLAKLQDFQQRALEADQAMKIASARREIIERWARGVSDSLGKALTLAPPPAEVALDDSTSAALSVRLALASASYWYDQARQARNAQLDLLGPGEEAELKARGLANPVKDLREDLMRRRDLIPYEGVLGGRMQFVPTGIAVLSPEWVYARFEDGHIGGSCLFAFDILPGGEIVWRRLAARQD